MSSVTGVSPKMSSVAGVTEYIFSDRFLTQDILRDRCVPQDVINDMCDPRHPERQVSPKMSSVTGVAPRTTSSETGVTQDNVLTCHPAGPFLNLITRLKLFSSFLACVSWLASSTTVLVISQKYVTSSWSWHCMWQDRSVTNGKHLTWRCSVQWPTSRSRYSTRCNVSTSCKHDEGELQNILWTQSLSVSPLFYSHLSCNSYLIYYLTYLYDRIQHYLLIACCRKLKTYGKISDSSELTYRNAPTSTWKYWKLWKANWSMPGSSYLKPLSVVYLFNLFLYFQRS